MACGRMGLGYRERRENMESRAHPPGLQDVLEFPLVEALFGRRARRFSLGASLPDGPLAFTSRHDPLPLSELEQMLVLTAAAGNTGWHYMIMRHARYAPHSMPAATPRCRDWVSATIQMSAGRFLIPRVLSKSSR